LITALLRRLRFSAGSLALLAVLAFVATALMVAAPRLANHYADAGLQGRIASASHFTRDLIFGARPDPSQPNPQPSEVPSAASLLEHRMRPELQAAIGQRWTAMQIGPALAIGDLGGGFPLELGLRWQSDAVDLVDVVEGRWPHTHVSGDAPIEAAMSEDVAEGLELEVGDTFTAAAGDGAHVVRIVGIFRPRDPVDPAWDSEPLVLKPFMPIGEDNVPWRGVLLTEADAITTAAKAELPVMYTWRFRLDEKAVTTANLDQIISDVIAARQTAAAAAGIPGVSLLTGLDVLLSRFEAELRSVSAILAVVQAGVLATIFGLALLASRSLVERRRSELALLRARGASIVSLGTRLALEAATAVPVAVGAGWLLGRSLVPGRPASTDWLAIVLALAAVMAVPIIAGLVQRHAVFVPDAELARPRRSPRRVTAEVFLVALAVLGVVLLHRRGLAPESGVDLYVVSVPVLLAGAVGVVALRLLPWPLRVMGRITARSRGAVAFLGFARAGRAAPAAAGPLVALVVAVSTGIFSAVVATTIDEGRDQATNQVLPARAIVEGHRFAPGTAQRLQEVQGVTDVAAFSSNPSQELYRDGAASPTPVLAVAVDAPAMQRVMAASGVRADLPDELVTATATGQPAPAVVSPDVAGEIGAGGAVAVQGNVFEFRVAAVTESFPGLPVDSRRYVVLPLQALEQSPAKPVLPSAFFVAGRDLDLDGLRAAGDQGQDEWREGLPGSVLHIYTPTTVTTWDDRRAELEGAGINQLLGFAFTVGAVGGSALGLLAVGFAVLAGVRARGRALSRLRTMGLSRRQGNRLLAYELLPLLTMGALAGVAVGVALPTLLAPVLDLTTFTGGVPTRPRLDPVVVAAVAGLVALGVVFALVLEQVVNRRLRLGDVLRLGEEMT